ncbi:MAG: hypothetical protein R3F49_13700 [Planctomycetota bacterium]
MAARRAAVEEWTRLALELRGATGEVDLLAAALRLECFERDEPTRIRRGSYNFGSPARGTRMRVRALFALPELASRSFDDGFAGVFYVNFLLGYSAALGGHRTPVPLQFDARGQLAPIVLDVGVDGMGQWECAFVLQVGGGVSDEVVLDNGLGSFAERTAGWLAAAAAEAGPRLDAPTAPSLEHARRAFASRVALLGDAASLERSAEFLVRVRGDRQAPPRPRWQGPAALDLVDALLSQEAQCLRAGRSPYAAHTEWTTTRGPFWRTYAHGPMDLPAWTLLPSAAPEQRLPLIVVLHEPGFDEGWALRLAGRGALFDEADRRGFAVLAPANAAFAQDPSALRALVASLALEAPLDLERVHVLCPASVAALAQRIEETNPGLVAGVHVIDPEVRPGSTEAGRDGASRSRTLGLESAFAQLLARL